MDNRGIEFEKFTDKSYTVPSSPLNNLALPASPQYTPQFGPRVDLTKFGTWKICICILYWRQLNHLKCTDKSTNTKIHNYILL